MIFSIKALKDRCDNIRIFGAGKRGKKLLDILDFYGMKDKVECFAVSSMNQNVSDIDGVPVKEIKNLKNDNKTLTVISIADKNEVHNVIDFLLDVDYVPFDKIHDKAFEEVELDYAKEYFRECEPRAELKVLPGEERGFCHVTISTDDNLNEYLWRYYYLMYPEIAHDKTELFPKGKLIESFEESYGRYRILKEELQPYLNQDIKGNKSKVKLFMARYVGDRYPIKYDIPDFITPIQVGAALTDERIYDTTDDAGENISSMNRDYSECTALYWMWKNASDSDYIGLCHYTRHFNINEEELALLGEANIDIVVTTPMFSGGTIKDFFVPRYLNEHDWNLMENAIIAHFPEYEETLSEYREAFCYPGANLSIMRRGIFDEYASFCFSVMQDVTNYYAERGIIREDRYAGYLMENLTALFVMHNKDKYKICFTDFNYTKYM